MAHDPTRSWPTGKGPNDTSIPGAAWLELLDEQAFPVVGAGAMVWNGTMWTPVSTQNRLPVEATLTGQLGNPILEKVIREVPGQSTELIWEIERPCIIDQLIFAANQASLQCRVSVRLDGDWVPLTDPRSDATAHYGISPSEAIKEYCALVDVLVYDLEDSRFKMRWKTPIHAPEGVRVEMRNLLSTPRQGAVTIFGREW